MSFLDNLENNLKALESREEKDPNERARREVEHARTLAEAPWADKLKHGAFTQQLMLEASQLGHRLRAKVYIAWIETTLRFELKGQKLDLRPTPTGIVAVFSRDGVEDAPQPVDLAANPADLLAPWAAL
jgi:hypothetical protein